MTKPLDHIMDAALRAGDELLIGQIVRKRVITAFIALRDHNADIEQAVAAAMLKAQSGLNWTHVSTTVRASWCEAARTVIDALVDAVLR